MLVFLLFRQYTRIPTSQIKFHFIVHCFFFACGRTFMLCLFAKLVSCKGITSKAMLNCISEIKLNSTTSKNLNLYKINSCFADDTFSSSYSFHLNQVIKIPTHDSFTHSRQVKKSSFKTFEKSINMIFIILFFYRELIIWYEQASKTHMCK